MICKKKQKMKILKCHTIFDHDPRCQSCGLYLFMYVPKVQVRTQMYQDCLFQLFT